MCGYRGPSQQVFIAWTKRIATLSGFASRSWKACLRILPVAPTRSLRFRLVAPFPLTGLSIRVHFEPECTFTTVHVSMRAMFSIHLRQPGTVRTHFIRVALETSNVGAGSWELSTTNFACLVLSRRQTPLSPVSVISLGVVSHQPTRRVGSKFAKIVGISIAIQVHSHLIKLACRNPCCLTKNI